MSNRNTVDDSTSSVDVSKLVQMLQGKGDTEDLMKPPVKRKKKPPLVPPKPPKKPAHLLSTRNALNSNVDISGDVNGNISSAGGPVEPTDDSLGGETDVSVNAQGGSGLEDGMDTNLSLNADASSGLRLNTTSPGSPQSIHESVTSADNSILSSSISNPGSPPANHSANVSPFHRRSLEQDAIRNSQISQILPNNEERVVLPERYLAKLRTSKQRGLSNLEDIAEDSDIRENGTAQEKNNNNTIVSNALADREKDLETAIKWLRQEILLMKQQDKILMSHLLDLGARLHQTRGMCSSHSISSSLLHVGLSNSSLDINNWSSFMSLDEGSLGKPLMDALPDHRKRDKLAFDTSGLARSVSTRAPTHADRIPVVIRRKASLPAVDIDEDLLEEEYYLS